jgi:hypothetical protein
MFRMAAQLGWFLGRKHDVEPGIKTICLGMKKMKDYALAWEDFLHKLSDTLVDENHAIGVETL